MSRLIFIYPRTKLYFNVIEIPFVMKQLAVIMGKSLKKTMLL